MLDTHAALRAEPLARAHTTAPLRLVGPALPRPRNRLKERLLALLRPAPAARCPGGNC
jgi:hypothetical protein